MLQLSATARAVYTCTAECPYCTGVWEKTSPAPARILVTENAERNVFRSGSSGVREFASLRIATRLISRWRWLDSMSSER